MVFGRKAEILQEMYHNKRKRRGGQKSWKNCNDDLEEEKFRFRTLLKHISLHETAVFVTSNNQEPFQGLDVQRNTASTDYSNPSSSNYTSSGGLRHAMTQ